MMSSADHYTYSISFDERDSVFVGRATEFPSLAAHGDTVEEALQEIRFIVEEVIRDLEEAGEPVPPPRADKSYSGKFVVRMPKSLHRALVEQAQSEGVSLNQLVVTRLAGHR
jgi:predicted HicB family RNase H-like nuclease